MNEKKSYSQILKSSSIMGGSAGIVMIFGMIKTKFAALFIGTTGVGLLSSFTSIKNLATIIFGLGLNQSAVREIAVAHGKNNLEAISRSVLTLKRASWFTGIMGMVMVVLLSSILSEITFETQKYCVDIAMIGIIVLLMNISNARMAHLQGIRKIGDIARIQILSAFFAMLSASLFYWQLGLEGIIPSLIITAFFQLLLSVYFASKLPLEPIEMSWKESLEKSSSMVRLGVVFMWTGFLSATVAYLTITLITSKISLEAVGIYSAAFALSGMFVNFVLQAMGADYYPRLAGLSDNKGTMNRLVNQQTEIGVLLATPGLLATIVLAPWIIQLFYSDAFSPAVGVMHWFILGAFGRVVSWPIGFVMLALGKGKIYALSEFFWNFTYIVFIWFGIELFGVEGVGMAFFMLYIVVTIHAYWIVNKLTGFAWEGSVKKMLLLLGFILTLSFVFTKLFSFWVAMIFGCILLVGTTRFCIRALIDRIGREHRLSIMFHKVPFINYFLGAKS